MKTFTEGHLEFEFNERWKHVIKLDEHADYRNGIEKLDETKSVDFLAILDGLDFGQIRHR